MIKSLSLKPLSVMNNFHPEDRLLRLIRGEKKERTGSMETVKFSVRFGWLKQALSMLKIKQVISINRILSVIISLLLIYTAYIWIRPRTSEKMLIPSLRVVSLENIDKEQQINLNNQNSKSSSLYSSMAKKRNLFKQLTVNPVILQDAGIDIKQLVKDLNLVGIVLDEGSQAIIENRKTKSVHYVNEGSAIGELKVNRISGSSVTLSYGLETMDLFL